MSTQALTDAKAAMDRARDRHAKAQAALGKARLREAEARQELESARWKFDEEAARISHTAEVAAHG